jgi:hypothetical protein
MKGSETDVPVHGEAGDYARIRERVGWRLHRRAARDRDETVSIDTITVLCPQYGSTWDVQGSKGAVDRGLKKTRTSHEARLCWLHRDVAVLAHP